MPVDRRGQGGAAQSTAARHAGAQKQADAICEALEPAAWWQSTCPADSGRFNATAEMERWAWWEGMLLRFARGLGGWKDA